MARCPIARVVRIIEGARSALDQHANTCGDRVAAVALNPRDHEMLQIVELWSLPVLAWSEVKEGRFGLICERHVVLIPDVDTFEDLVEQWAYGSDPPIEGAA